MFTIHKLEVIITIKEYLMISHQFPCSSLAYYIVKPVMFETQFVAADIMTGVAGLICAAGLWRDAQWAQVWGGVFAGGLLFLGCMDVSYNLYAGNYATLGPAMMMENAINLYCFTFGPYLIYYLVRHRRVGTHA